MKHVVAIALAVIGLELAMPSTARAQVAYVATIAPPTAAVGDLVTITGIGFGAKNVIVQVGGVPALVVIATGNRVVFRVPVGVPPGTTTVTVTNPGGHTGSIGFEVSGLITLKLDDADRVTAVIDERGGSLTSGSAGVVYTLTIPPGALAGPETIALTPIASITGMPFDAVLGSVHFAPEGLEFFRPATLSIALPAGANTHGLAGFGAEGNGQSLHLTPFGVASGAFTMLVPHFSVSGLGTGSLALANAFQCQGVTLECTYVHMLGQALRQIEQTVCGTDCATPADLEDHFPEIEGEFQAPEIAILKQWFGTVLLRLTTSALTSDAGLTSAEHDYGAWRSFIGGSCGLLDCIDVPDLAADVNQGDAALAMAYAPAFRRSQAACTDRHTSDLIGEVLNLGLLGKGGLPADDGPLREQFGCQLVITGSLPSIVHIGDTVPITVTLGVRTGGPAGPVTPLPGVSATLTRTDGCGLLDGSSASLSGTTDGTGALATSIKISLPCLGSQAATEVSVSVGDVVDPMIGLVALRHTVKLRTKIALVITVSPANAVVQTNGTVAYTAEAQGIGPLRVNWNGSGGTIPHGPSTGATYTAGALGGLFAVTATIADDSTQSKTVNVTILGGAVRVVSAGTVAEVKVSASAGFSPGVQDDKDFLSHTLTTIALSAAAADSSLDGRTAHGSASVEVDGHTQFDPLSGSLISVGGSGTASVAAATVDPNLTGATDVGASARGNTVVTFEITGGSFTFVLSGGVGGDGFAVAGLWLDTTPIAQLDSSTTSVTGVLQPGVYTVLANTDIVTQAGAGNLADSQSSAASYTFTFTLTPK